MLELDIKKAECQRINVFELWCCIRLLRALWTARRSNQSFLKKINPEYSLEGLMLKLNLQYVGHLMWRTDSLKESLMVGKIEGRRRKGDGGWDGWITSLTQWTWVWANLRNIERQGSLLCCSPWATKSQPRLNNWAMANSCKWVH